MEEAAARKAADAAPIAAPPSQIQEDAGTISEGAASSDVIMDRAFFSFPFEPYDIQLDLMRQLWHTIEARHIGIFESPTGTGKSMSLICGALTWLVNNTDAYGLPLPRATTQPPAVEESKSSSFTHTSIQEGAKAEPSWLASYEQQAAARNQKEQQDVAKLALQKIESIRQDPVLQSKKRKMGIAYNHHERKRSRPSHADPRQSSATGPDTDGEQHLVDAYDSGGDGRAFRNDHGDDSDDDGDDASHGRVGDKPAFGVLKIIYCSRTHSQISQFVREIKNTAFSKQLRVVSLGSRKNLCVNESVTSLRSDLRMTDRCLDMLQGSKSKSKADKKKKSSTKCPFYERELLGRYKDYALAHVQDIEELHTLGQEMSICSYYGARESVPLAQVIAVPYSMLLSKDTRDSLGIDVKDSVIILDEAHNIVEALNATYQVQVTNKQLVISRRSVWAYLKKYEKRLKGKNTFYIKQLLTILESLAKYLRQAGKVSAPTVGGATKCVDESTAPEPSAKMMNINDFVFSAGIDNFNMFKIVHYLNESELPKKIMGFMDAERANAPSSLEQPPTAMSLVDDQFESRHISPLRTIEALFKSLTNATSDGRILVQPHNPSKGSEGEIKFVLLNPANHFQEIVDNARSIIMAGGTMQPISQVIDQLFATVPSNRIDLFSCGHVIPPENLLGFSLSTGPSQKHLEFTFGRRNDMEALDELGRIMMNLARVVPTGVVVFFPSYRFEESAVRRWKETKQFDQIDAKKRIFREPKQSDQLADVLSQYSAACRETTDSTATKAGMQSSGALLLSVVGGKMSEGINFSDDLARCVVMVGLPYPNARDPELAEKMAFLEKRKRGAGRAFYDSLCMKAVNQSIGRSIRHQKDYSTIVLIDHRYSSPNIRKQLPEWIQRRVQPPSSFGHVYSQLAQFFRSKAVVK